MNKYNRMNSTEFRIFTSGLKNCAKYVLKTVPLRLIRKVCKWMAGGDIQ